MRFVICSVFYPYRGGIAQFNARIFQELAKEHDVYAVNFSRQYPGLLFPGKTQVVSAEDRAQAIPSSRFLDSIWPPSWKSTAEAIKTMAPDVVIMRHWVTVLAPAQASVARRLTLAGIPVVLVVDNAIPHERKWYDRLLISKLFRQVRGFMVMSDKVLRDVHELAPGKPTAIHAHPPYSHFGVPADRQAAHRRLSTNPSLRTLLFFGFIRDYKGLDLLLEAYAGLPDQYQLIIAGECYGSFANYQRQIDALSDAHRVIQHIRYIPDQEVADYFSAADVVVLPYKSATQSGIAAIARHFGTPVILSDAGGLAEGVSEGAGITIVQGVTSEKLRAAIEAFFNGGHREAVLPEDDAAAWRSYTRTLLELCTQIIGKK
jgi:glycosyltransferase involved in cell wall biosynthesis